MGKKYKILLSVIVVIIIFLIIFLLFSLFNKDVNIATYEVIDQINGYNYTLDDRDTKLMEEEFKKLKDILLSDEINYDAYASVLSNLFVIDLFTIANKENKYDVGSLEYVLPSVKDNFKLNVMDTIYKYINEDNEYPIVNKILANTVTTTKYKYNNKEYNAYKVLVAWDYEKDLGYYTNGELILINENDILYVVSFKGVVEN